MHLQHDGKVLFRKHLYLCCLKGVKWPFSTVTCFGPYWTSLHLTRVMWWLDGSSQTVASPDVLCRATWWVQTPQNSMKTNIHHLLEQISTKKPPLPLLTERERGSQRLTGPNSSFWTALSLMVIPKQPPTDSPFWKGTATIRKSTARREMEAISVFLLGCSPGSVGWF